LYATLSHFFNTHGDAADAAFMSDSFLPPYATSSRIVAEMLDALPVSGIVMLLRQPRRDISSRIPITGTAFFDNYAEFSASLSVLARLMNRPPRPKFSGFIGFFRFSE